jgi:hypothetical protein
MSPTAPITGSGNGSSARAVGAVVATAKPETAVRTIVAKLIETADFTMISVRGERWRLF